MTGSLERTDLEESKASFDTSSTWFEHQISATSDASTTHSLEELSMPTFFEKHCSHIDEMTSQVVRESSIRSAIRVAVADRQVSVSVADPRSPDAYLIAVSDHFETMTGYGRSEILGKNCRFLNAGCKVNQGDLLRLRTAVKTGESFTGVLENRKKSGELFLNLLDLHGLTVARNHSTGDELWFLVGIQADVSELSPCAMEEAEMDIHRVANDIRQKLADQLCALALSGALKFTVVPQRAAGREERRQLRSKEPVSPSGEEYDPEIWTVLPSPEWRGSNTLSRGTCEATKGLEVRNDARSSAPSRGLVGRRHGTFVLVVTSVLAVCTVLKLRKNQ